MLKALKQPSIAYFAFMLLITILLITLMCLGYSLIVLNENVWLILNVFIEIRLLVLFKVRKENTTKAANVIAQLLPLISLMYIDTLGLIIDGVKDSLFALHAVICFLSCVIMSIMCENRLFVKIIGIVFNGIFLSRLLVGLLVFGLIGENTVVRQVPSPNQAYTAVLINSDLGALGGDTLVDVEHNNLNFAGILKIKERIYAGRWGEFETMTIAWKDDDTLLIDGRAYDIN